MPHIPPLRIDVALMLLLLLVAALAVAALRMRWRRRHPPHGIRVDLVGGDAGRPEPPPGP